MALHIFAVSGPPLGDAVKGCMMNEPPLIGPIVRSWFLFLWFLTLVCRRCWQRSEQTVGTHAHLRYNNDMWSEGFFLQDAWGWWQALMVASVCQKVMRDLESESFKTETEFQKQYTSATSHLHLFFSPFFKLWEKQFLRVDDLPRITQMAFWQILRIFQLLMMWNFLFQGYTWHKTCY